MNAKAHTSGPWALGIETDDASAQVINSEGQHVCTVAIDPLPDHAHLIAAAPDLLAALKALADHVFRLESKDNVCSSAWMDAREAIERAEGGQE